MASIEFETSVVGDTRIAEHFRNFQNSVRERLRRAMAGLGSSIASMASGSAPRLSGEMADHILASQSESDRGISETIAPRGKRNAFVAKLMERGVVNHGTSRNKAPAGNKRLRARRIYELRASGSWRIQPRPFMAPAFQAHRDRINATIEAALAETVQEANV